MILTEKVKSFFKQKKSKNPSSIVNPNNVMNNLSDDNSYLRFTDFFDYQEDNNFFNMFSDMTQEELCLKQMAKIQSYRQCAMQPEVATAIDVIANEIVFCYEDFPLKLVFDFDNDELQEALQKAFDKIIKLGNFDKNLFDVVKKIYIDGQAVLHCEYDKNLKKGIQKLRLLDPCGFMYDYREKVWKYLENMPNMLYATHYEKEEYSQEEIVRIDFGLYDNFICLSYLEYALKTANVLKSLEDLLLPLRFSRSISRRVFNVDIGDLPNKRAEEYMKKVQDKFKYKKFYNNETGEISNQQHITSMVEDYWFAKRSTGKGTDVTTLDESGNLGELADILYFNKKLYRALNIPTSKLDIDPDSDHSFSIDSTESTQEDVKFMNFITRIRKVYSQLFKELFRREVISTGIMTDKEWSKYQDQIKIEFTNENLFIEKLKIQLLQNKIEYWNNVKEIGGLIVPFKDLMKQVFGFSDKDIDENFDAIMTEMKDKNFHKLYELADIEIASELGIAGMTDAEGQPLDAENAGMGLFDDKDEDEESENEEPEETSKPNEDAENILKQYGLK